MPPIAYFGIESKGLSLVIDLLILFVVVLYGSLVYWTYADARRRIVDPMLVGCATAASLFPFVGTIVYMILRPPEYLEDVRERELDLQAAEARLYELDHGLCPHCDYRVERDFIRCPSCLRKLKERCVSCSRPLDRTWTICPYCETEVVAAKSTRRATRRERASAERASAPSTERASASAERASAPPTERASATAEKASASTRARADGDTTRPDPLEAQPASAAQARAAERAAGRAAARAPRPATVAGEPSPFVVDTTSMSVAEDPSGEDATPEPAAAKPSARTRAVRRPRPTS